MGDYQNESFLQAAARGNLEECRKLQAQNNIDVNYADKEGNTALFHSISNSQIETVRFLINNEANIELPNGQQQTPLHIACDKFNKEIILLLLCSGADPQVKDVHGQKPGASNMEVNSFLKSIYSENKAFNVLKGPQKQKLISIFEDIDVDNQKSIDMQKAVKFNKYIDDINDSLAERDARDFLKTAAVCNGQRVNVDEWLFSFSKCLVAEPGIFDKFLEDYDKTVEKKQKLRLQNLE